MPVSDLKQNIPEGFDGPTDLPDTPEERRIWQEANRAWWESHPMRYDFSDKIQAREFSREFYREIDERFYSDLREFMPWKAVPFEALLDFASLSDHDVLEIGVGNGSHAQLISQRAGSYTGIDLTDYAVKSTTERLRQLEVEGNAGKQHPKILRMDAENMTFPDCSFDLVWSWGVIHHSANTRKILEEIRRVLRPGGVAITMVYHRSFWNYYIFAGLFGGLASGTLLKTLSFHRARQNMIDGAIARYYSINEWRALTSEIFELEEIRIYGSKAELFPLPNGKLKRALKSITPNSLSRFLTNRCSMGMFLVSRVRKPQAER